jgi:hypothetical protein
MPTLNLQSDITYFYYMVSSYIIYNDGRSLNLQPDFKSSIQMISGVGGGTFWVSFLSKFDGNSLFGATGSALVPT